MQGKRKFFLRTLGPALPVRPERYGGPLQALRKQARPSWSGGGGGGGVGGPTDDSVSIIVFHTCLPTLSPVSAPYSDTCKTRVREKQLNV